MEFSISTRVNTEFSAIDKHLSLQFLLKVNPQFPPFSIIRFDGEHKDDEIEVQLNFGLFKENWKYRITESYVTEREWRFEEIGIKLPFFLKEWRHSFTLRDSTGFCTVTDHVMFVAPFGLLNYLLYPWLYLHFQYRKPAYRKMFEGS